MRRGPAGLLQPAPARTVFHAAREAQGVHFCSLKLRLWYPEVRHRMLALYVVFVLSIAALVGAAIAVARYIRRHKASEPGYTAGQVQGPTAASLSSLKASEENAPEATDI